MMGCKNSLVISLHNCNNNNKNVGSLLQQLGPPWSLTTGSKLMRLHYTLCLDPQSRLCKRIPILMKQFAFPHCLLCI